IVDCSACRPVKGQSLQSRAHLPEFICEPIQSVAARISWRVIHVLHKAWSNVEKVLPADQRLVDDLVYVLPNEDRHQALTVRRKPSSANSLICSARLRIVFWSKTSPTMLRLTVLCVGAPPPAAGACVSAMAPPADPPPERPTPPAG